MSYNFCWAFHRSEDLGEARKRISTIETLRVAESLMKDRLAEAESQLAELDKKRVMEKDLPVWQRTWSAEEMKALLREKADRLTERAVEVDRIRDLRIHLQMSSALSGEADDSEPMFS